MHGDTVSPGPGQHPSHRSNDILRGMLETYSQLFERRQGRRAGISECECADCGSTRFVVFADGVIWCAQCDTELEDMSSHELRH